MGLLHRSGGLPAPMGEADSGLARLGEGLKRPSPQPSHHPSASFLTVGVRGYIALWPVFLEAFPWPSHGLQWPFHTCPRHTHTYSSPSPSNQHVLGSPTLCFSPTLQLLWFHRQKRQLKSGPQPTSLSTGNNPELEEVGGETQKGKGREPVDWGGEGEDQAGVRH